MDITQVTSIYKEEIQINAREDAQPPLSETQIRRRHQAHSALHSAGIRTADTADLHRRMQVLRPATAGRGSHPQRHGRRDCKRSRQKLSTHVHLLQTDQPTPAWPHREGHAAQGPATCVTPTEWTQGSSHGGTCTVLLQLSGSGHS